MDISYAEIGAIMVGVMGAFKLLEKGLDFASKQLFKGNKDNKQEIEIAVLQEKLTKIECNDLAHIKALLDINSTEHRDIFVKMSEISTTQKLILERLK